MRVTIVYGVPPGSRKFDMWHDGFTAAVEVLSDLHDIEWINALSATPRMLERAAATTDVVLVKSSFGGAPDAWSRPVLAHFPSVPTCLMISGTGPPRHGDLGRFDVLFHETDWYLPFVARHPNVIHAFGVDTTVMRPRREVPKDIDWLMVGQPAFYKGPDELLSLTGRRVLVGDLRGVPERTIRDLVNGGVDVLDFVPYHELAEYYARATTVVVACTLHHLWRRPWTPCSTRRRTPPRRRPRVGTSTSATPPAVRRLVSETLIAGHSRGPRSNLNRHTDADLERATTRKDYPR